MKQISALIMVKEKEPGLLSIAGNREKSLVPVFDGKKIIDFYLSLLITNGFHRVTVVTDREHTRMKDYLIFAYNTHRIKVISDPDVLRTAVNLLKTRKNECVLLLRADHIFVPDWESVRKTLLDLPPENYEIQSTDRESIGFLLHDSRKLQELRGKHARTVQKDSRIDGAWEHITGWLRPFSKKHTLKSLCLAVRTVVDYYRAHFRFLDRIEELIPILPMYPNFDDEEPARITGTGYVRNSKLSSSAVVEGFVEHSILFSHVRVGKNARIVNSIVMENNFIGNGALIYNSILCDGNELFSRVTPNIGEDVRIGEDDMRGANTRYPEYIHGGITLIGQNVEIPKGFRISRNCYIGSEVGKSVLKGIEKVKAGDTILQS
jgi:NDP-sugar pyrophosphorylase family protein